MNTSHPDDGWNLDPRLLHQIQRWAPHDWDQEREDWRRLQQFVPLTPSDRSYLRTDHRIVQPRSRADA